MSLILCAFDSNGLSLTEFNTRCRIYRNVHFFPKCAFLLRITGDVLTINVLYKRFVKHEGDIPVNIKYNVVSSCDTLAIRKKISGSACVSACEIGSYRLKSVICII